MNYTDLQTLLLAIVNIHQDISVRPELAFKEGQWHIASVQIEAKEPLARMNALYLRNGKLKRFKSLDGAVLSLMEVTAAVERLTECRISYRFSLESKAWVERLKKD